MSCHLRPTRTANGFEDSAALISLLDLSVEDAEHILKRYVALKEIEENLRNRRLEQEKPLEIETKLTGLQTTISHQGSWKKKNCIHFQDNYCRRWIWSSQPILPYQIGQPLEKDGKYHINPDFIRCATCPLFRERGATSIEDVNAKIDGVEEKAEGVQGTVDAILNGLGNTPDYNIRNRHKCKSCGAKRFVAVKTVCTQCGADTGPWGFHPKKKR